MSPEQVVIPWARNAGRGDRRATSALLQRRHRNAIFPSPEGGGTPTAKSVRVIEVREAWSTLALGHLSYLSPFLPRRPKMKNA